LEEEVRFVSLVVNFTQQTKGTEDDAEKDRYQSDMPQTHILDLLKKQKDGNVVRSRQNKQSG